MPGDPTSSPIRCARCDVELEYGGPRAFHEGTRWGVLGQLGELLINREHFDVYYCPTCGGVEFFVAGIGEAMRKKKPAREERL